MLLCGNVLSALVSSSFKGFSAALRLHSLAEAVNLASLSLFGLIRSFHNNNSLYVHEFLIHSILLAKNFRELSLS